MALQTSGPISLGDVQGEFGGSHPIGINEYYGADNGVPTSGTISLSDFYGTSDFRGPFTETFTTPGEYTIDMPAGANNIVVTLRGGRGGMGGDDSAPGGAPGYTMQQTFTVNPTTQSTTFTCYVGGAGQRGLTDVYGTGGGAGGYGMTYGGRGGDAGPYPKSGGGGGGGGSSGLKIDGLPVICMGGSGGGGGGSHRVPGRSGFNSQNAGNGTLDITPGFPGTQNPQDGGGGGGGGAGSPGGTGGRFGQDVVDQAWGGQSGASEYDGRYCSAGSYSDSSAADGYFTITWYT